jgi:hypothetical protein
MGPTSSHDAPTAIQPALATAAGDQCTTCGSPLAPDQRYCVNCGQRRGQARLPVLQTATATTPVARAALPRAARMSVNTTLIAGIGTLLLAMGVGVLIGRSSQKAAPTRAAAPVQVVTVAGAGGAAPTASAKATPSKSHASSKAVKAPSAKQVAKSIKGTTVKLPPHTVVKVGSPGHGPGYQNGKFTGNFFGGG